MAESIGKDWKIWKDEHYGIKPKLVRIIKSMYKVCSNNVKNRQVDSDWFNVKMGKTRSALPPVVYHIYGQMSN